MIPNHILLANCAISLIENKNLKSKSRRKKISCERTKIELSRRGKEIPGFSNYFISEDGVVVSNKGYALRKYTGYFGEYVCLIKGRVNKHCKIKDLLYITYKGDIPDNHEVSYIIGQTNVLENLILISSPSSTPRSLKRSVDSLELEDSDEAKTKLPKFLTLSSIKIPLSNEFIHPHSPTPSLINSPFIHLEDDFSEILSEK